MSILLLLFRRGSQLGKHPNDLTRGVELAATILKLVDRSMFILRLDCELLMYALEPVLDNIEELSLVYVSWSG